MDDVVSSSQSYRGSRAYKSRRERPCDLCRARKVACRIDLAPPCNFCYTQGSDCTFETAPIARKRALPAEYTLDVTSQRRGYLFEHIDDQPTFGPPLEVRPGSSLDSQDHIASAGLLLSKDEGVGAGDGSRESILSLNSTSPSEDTASPPEQTIPRRVSALASYDGISARIAGDPHSLAQFLWDDNDECSVSHVTYRRMSAMRLVSNGDSSNASAKQSIAFVVGEEGSGRTGEPRPENDSLNTAARDLELMFTDGQRARLVELFFQYVYPYFPILSRVWFFTSEVPLITRIKSLPLSLESAVYATSLPFILYDDHLSTTLAHSSPSRAQLYRISWMAIQNELHAPTLSTLQACLLMLQRGPTNQYIAATPFKASLLGWTVNLANILGLNHDCSGWIKLPVWERRVRSRLWWATFSMDCWTSIELHAPLLTCVDETDVPSLTKPSSIDILAIPPECVHFRHLTTLSSIVHDIHRTFFSIRATASLSQNLTASLERARSLRGRLSNWKQQYSADCPLPSYQTPQNEPDGNASLDLAYFAANVLLFRALLRPLSNSSGDLVELSQPIYAVLAGAVTCCRDAVQFLETIVGFSSVWNGFWHSCSQSNFAIISSFLAQFYMQHLETNGGHSTEIMSLIERWRRAIRNGAGSGGWGHTLMSLALLRLNGTMSMFAEDPSKST